MPMAGTFELYGVPLAGGDSVKLNAPLVTGGDVYDFQFSPNSNWIIYRADQDIDEVCELFSLARGALGVVDALFSDRFE